MTSHWPNYCDASTWKVKSNSLDIDFIHRIILGRSWNRVWCASLCCRCIKVPNRFTWLLPFLSMLLYWQWLNSRIFQCQWEKREEYGYRYKTPIIHRIARMPEHIIKNLSWINFHCLNDDCYVSWWRNILTILFELEKASVSHTSRVLFSDISPVNDLCRCILTLLCYMR